MCNFDNLLDKKAGAKKRVDIDILTTQNTPALAYHHSYWIVHCIPSYLNTANIRCFALWPVHNGTMSPLWCFSGNKDNVNHFDNCGRGLGLCYWSGGDHRGGNFAKVCEIFQIKFGKINRNVCVYLLYNGYVCFCSRNTIWHSVVTLITTGRFVYVIFLPQALETMIIILNFIHNRNCIMFYSKRVNQELSNPLLNIFQAASESKDTWCPNDGHTRN